MMSTAFKQFNMWLAGFLHHAKKYCIVQWAKLDILVPDENIEPYIVS